jgi:F0F1-type ATP synthase epsilon subunit
MHNSFHLTIRTPNETLYTGTVKSLTFNSENGSMQVLANHASLTTTLLFSPVTVVEEKGSEENFLARNGLFLFNNRKNSGLLLALYGEKRSEVSHQTVKEYLKFLEEQLAKGENLSEFQILYLKGEKLAVEQQMKEVEQ